MAAELFHADGRTGVMKLIISRFTILLTRLKRGYSWKLRGEIWSNRSVVFFCSFRNVLIQSLLTAHRPNFRPCRVRFTECVLEIICKVKSPLNNGSIVHGFCVGGIVLQRAVYKLVSFKKRAEAIGRNCPVAKSQNVNLGINIWVTLTFMHHASYI